MMDGVYCRRWAPLACQLGGVLACACAVLVFVPVVAFMSLWLRILVFAIKKNVINIIWFESK